MNWLRRLRALVQRIVRWLTQPIGAADLGPFTLTIEVDMTTLIISWTRPETREGGAPLPISELAHCKLEFRGKGQSAWNLIQGNIPPDDPGAPIPLTRRVESLPAGTWEAQVTWTDVHGMTRSKVGEATVQPPIGEIGDFDVTLTIEG